MPNGRTAALRRWIHNARKVRFLRLRSRKAYCPAFSTAALAARMVVLRRAEKTLGGLVDFLVLGVRGHTAFDARHDGSPSYEMGDGSPRGRGSAKVCGPNDQAFGKKYFLMLSPSVLNSTRVPRS